MTEPFTGGKDRIIGRPTRDQRLALQDRDLGDDSDKVWIAKGGGYASLRYHDDPDCPRLYRAESREDTTRGHAKLRWKAPCKVCTIDTGSDQS